MIVWLDLETTGLEPVTCRPLEIGMVITDDQLEERDRVSMKIWQPAGWADRLDYIVRDMHEKSGLIYDINTAGNTLLHLPDVEAFMLRWLKERNVEPGTLPLGGSTIGFDRSFLKIYMPMLHQFFHYRSIDVSSVKELVRRWYDIEPPPARKNHRVIPDIEDTLNELRFYRDRVFVGADSIQ